MSLATASASCGGFDLGTILAKKISRPASSLTAFADRAQRSIRIESTVAFTVSEEVLKAVISLGTCVPGTTNTANAAIAISKQETDALMLDQSTSTVYVAASLLHGIPGALRPQSLSTGGARLTCRPFGSALAAVCNRVH